MKAILLAAVTTLLPLHAQIFADFTVSAGGTALGTFRARLDHDKAPRTCANFIGLATGQRPWIDLATNRIIEDTPFYTGRIFHRLIHNFMIQGGSSDGRGSAGPGYIIQDEFHPDLRHSGRYILSMAKTSLPGTGNSQFFITLTATPHLNDKHSVFGEVVSGKAIVDRFADPALHPTDAGNRPLTEIAIDSIVISGPSLASFDLHDPQLELPSFKDAGPIPSRDADASSFTTTFDRKPRHDYLYHYSFDLKSWITLPDTRNLLSLDHEADYAFSVIGVTFDRFFAMIGAVDYTFLMNPTPDILHAGSSIAFTSRTGETLNLLPDGAGSGTWSDSSGGSGTLSSFSITDSAPATGQFRSTATQAQFIPLLTLGFELDAPGGPANRRKHELTLDFRTPDSGWSDGTGWNTLRELDGVSFLHAFTIAPAP